ncbi:hypothetical protein SPHINGO391_510187 [Sphingomonas aurantiaca]|uniref:Uncharacterized protein n=1 Tax=Sphingomonas aurantiaca TaxID=185949 RepID=A0A5E8AFY5_9SPHN|nr:hypothetical protein SPHINGO391_510187 [Sphingomonas aurantiaca]
MFDRTVDSWGQRARATGDRARLKSYRQYEVYEIEVHRQDLYFR